MLEVGVGGRRSVAVPFAGSRSGSAVAAVAADDEVDERVGAAEFEGIELTAGISSFGRDKASATRFAFPWI